MGKLRISSCCVGLIVGDGGKGRADADTAVVGTGGSDLNPDVVADWIWMAGVGRGRIALADPGVAGVRPRAEVGKAGVAGVRPRPGVDGAGVAGAGPRAEIGGAGVVGGTSELGVFGMLIEIVSLKLSSSNLGSEGIGGRVLKGAVVGEDGLARVTLRAIRSFATVESPAPWTASVSPLQRDLSCDSVENEF